MDGFEDASRVDRSLAAIQRYVNIQLAEPEVFQLIILISF
jgi:hypothetical protein